MPLTVQQLLRSSLAYASSGEHYDANPRTAVEQLSQSDHSKRNGDFGSNKWTAPYAQLLDETPIKETAVGKVR